jgi:acyl-CoA thioester hydrolase
MNEPDRVEVEARSYELDPYGHVNNAVFVNWLEHGRLCYLRERGMTWTSLPEQFGVRVVIVSMSLDWRAEVNLGDRLVIESGIEKFGNSSFTFAQRIRFEDGRPAADATAVMVVTGEGGKAVAMPVGLREALESRSG